MRRHSTLDEILSSLPFKTDAAYSPPAATTGFLRQVLILPQAGAELKGKPISRIERVSPIVNTSMQGSYGNACVIVRLQMTPPYTYAVAKMDQSADPVQQSYELEQLMYNLGATFYKSHGRNDSPKKVWATNGIKHIYEQDENEVYDHLRAQLANKAIQAMLPLRSKKPRGVIALSLGCGEGDDLAALESACPKDWPVMLYGLDTQIKNITVASKKHSGRNYKFTLTTLDEDATRIPDTIKNIRTSACAKLHTPNLDDCVITVNCVGFIARQVLQGTVAALRVLQRLHVAAVDQISLTSLTEILTSPEMMNAAGYQFNTTTLFDGEIKKFLESSHLLPAPALAINCIVMQPMSEDDYFAHIIERSLARSHEQRGAAEPLELLDLSQTSTPEALLAQFLAHETHDPSRIKMIDLSWSLVNNPQELLNCLKQFPNLDTLYISLYDKKNGALFEALETLNITLLGRMSAGGLHETDSYSSSMHGASKYELLRALPLYKKRIAGGAAASAVAGAAAIFKVPADRGKKTVDHRQPKPRLP